MSQPDVEPDDGDAENIFQEARRWSLGEVDDKSFRAYLAEYLSGVREMAEQIAARL